MHSPINPVGEPSPRMVETAPEVLFEYAGSTGLTATGPFTGRRYRFDGPGARVEVDARDVPSLMGIPNLRRVTKPVPSP
jgi:hypothetical protein